MPAAIVAIASAGAAAWVGGLAIVTSWGTFITAAVKFGVAFLVTTVGNKLLGVRPDVPSNERRETIRSPAANRRVIFGVVRTGGVLVQGVSTGDENKHMHMVIALQHGEVEHIDTRFFLNNKPSDDPSFAGKVHVEHYYGNPDQTACASMISADSKGWSANHRLRGIAYAYLRLEYDQTAFPTGLPTASFIVKGTKVYDPRSYAGAAPAWSNNSALCILAYLRAPWGMNAPDDLIDFDSFVTAANICDEVVGSIDPALAGLRRYTFNGIVDLGAAPASILESMQTSCAGHLVFSNGKYRLYVGAFTPSVGVINSSMLRGDPVIRLAPSRSEIFNTVRGSYVEPKQDWQEVDYAEQVHAAGLAEDGSEIVQALSFPFTTNGATCQRLAKLAVSRARGGTSIKLPMNWSGLQFQLWNVVTLDLPGPQAMRGTYRIVEFSLAEGGGVDVTLQAEDPSYYDWNPATDEKLVPALASYVPTINTALVITANETYPITQRPQPRLTVTWRMSAYTSTQAMALINAGNFGGFQVQWRKTTAVGYALTKDQAFVKSLDAQSKFSFTTTAIEPNTAYYVRVRAYFQGGGGGAWTEVLLQPGTVMPAGVLLNLSDQNLQLTVPAQTSGGQTTTGGNVHLVFYPDGRLSVQTRPIFGQTSSSDGVESTPLAEQMFPLQWSATAVAPVDAARCSVRATLIGNAKGTLYTSGPYGIDVSFSAASPRQTKWLSLGGAGAERLPFGFKLSFKKTTDGYGYFPLLIEICESATGQILTSAYYLLKLEVAA